jgi:glycosyltransferase involved in cell wall biosynthesis
MLARSSVVLVGPLAPRDVSDLLYPADAEAAEEIVGYRGIPTSELARALVAAGVAVEVVTGSEDLDESLTLRGPGLEIFLAPRRSRARHKAADLFKAERAEMRKLLHRTSGAVLHAHWTYEFAWAAQDDARPLLVTAHDAPLTILRQYRDAYRAARTAMAYLVRTRITELTAVSPYLASRWRREMLYRRPIRVIPNIARALVAVPQSPRRRRGALIVDVADSGRVKNLSLLLRALARLRSEGRDVELGLIGPGLGAHDDFAARARREGLADGVHFWGRLNGPDLAARLSVADVFAHPSREECCPMAVIEAMRSGLPVVVAPRSGGTPWVVDHGAAGLIASGTTPKRFADAIASLLDHPELARELAREALARTELLFAPEAVATAYQEEYERIHKASPRIQAGGSTS